ncbi:DNA (cytosine-5-)-methyltransferase [Mucilaginibacter arboris]|uniref:Cytosine-specific methyltransferase n=1 Tax=Mucilaginibacter arboris TaxID=2682090 RepID=A0A7K1T1Y6_9SPHI|nr:DNA (cytosine-5-)-methyltransferase [Mucilaginibacter arboris]MVN23310.1 DNA (cytosine-5-)-methyltransferase [Mucilaginibacter arboris]
MTTVKFIDLFAGMGGIRLGFESAFNKAGFKTECVMTSEIKPSAIKTLLHNFSHKYFVGDISNVPNEGIPDFDFLLGGFPCQPFSAGGKRYGFMDTRGTLFFEIERILAQKKPYGFILENVEGLVRHDLENKSDKVGRTLKVILNNLSKLDYEVSFRVLDASDFNLPQARKRIYIIGTKNQKISLDDFEKRKKTLKEVLEKGLPTMDTKLTRLLLNHFDLKDLHGKSIKDKRGGDSNIHSWDIGLKGPITKEQSILLTKLFKQRRKKNWASEIGIKWMDGMSLTLQQISTFHIADDLEEMLEDLVNKGYLRFEHPKKLLTEVSEQGFKTLRVQDTTLPKGYNIVSGKLSFEINKVLDPEGVAPTLVATDMARFVVPDKGGLRRITLREGLRLFGYPESYVIPVSINEGFDLLGNTVAVNVIKAITKRLVNSYIQNVQEMVKHDVY